MINLNFEVDRVNILVNSIMEFVKISASDSSRIKLCIAHATNSNSFLQLMRNHERLNEILTSEEIEICREITLNKQIYGESFIEVVNNGYEFLNAYNYLEVFNTCISEYKSVAKEFSVTDFISKVEKKLPMFVGTMKKLMSTEEFENLYSITYDYKNKLENNWNNNKENISNFVEGITRKVFDKDAKVMVLPPIFEKGQTCTYKDRDIVYSHCFDPNVKNNELIELVYLTHEFMHSQGFPYLNRKDRVATKNLHGFIQYLADNELCNRLSMQKGIAYQYGDNPHHGIDNRTFLEMYPYFIGYLYRNEENPVECIENNMKKNIKFSAVKDENGNAKQLYSPIAIANYFRGKKNMSPYDFANLDFSKAIYDFGAERHKIAIHSKDQVKTGQEH